MKSEIRLPVGAAGGPFRMEGNPSGTFSGEVVLSGPLPVNEGTVHFLGPKWSPQEAVTFRAAVAAGDRAVVVTMLKEAGWRIEDEARGEEVQL